MCFVTIMKFSLNFVFLSVGKTPEEVVKRYLQKVRNPPEEVSSLPVYDGHIIASSNIS